jgi:two-component system phosphate regulon response regulator PhoB
MANPTSALRESGNTLATILVVEDDPSLNSTLCYNLRRAGYAPAAVSDGEAALVRLREVGPKIDLVLLDMMLPRLSGLQVLRAMRQLSPAPVLILSAKGEDRDKIDGLDLGADDYLVKPFALGELMARIRALLRTRSQSIRQVESEINRGALKIEPAARRVTVAGTEVHLRPKEFGLLLTLALEGDKVLTRQQLLDMIWGEDIVVDERTVDVHVSWLRSKLRAAGFEGDAIQTAYGVGYRFSVPGAAPSSHEESIRSNGGEVRAGRVAGLNTR